MKLQIVSMDKTHIEEVAAIEKACFSMPWSCGMLEEELYNDCAAYLVALDEQGSVIGYAGLQVAVDEGYITNVAVREDCRKQKVAARLMDVFLRFAEANRLRLLTLEVRPSNAAAIALYEKFGFSEVGRRKNYYEKPKEDALIMTRYFEQEEKQ